jgi:hypothetical protein
VQERAQAIEANQQIAPQTNENAISVTNAVNQALTDAGAGSNTGTSGSSGSSSSGSSSSSSSSYLPSGAWGLTDVTSVVYENQSMVLTQDFWVTAPTGVAASRYELWGKNYNSVWQSIASKGINERTRHLAKVFSEPQNLLVKLYGANTSYYTLGTYTLAVNGSQKVLQNTATQTVSGTVYLPGTATAGSGGVPLRVYLSGTSSDGYDYNALSEVTIPQGSGSVSYSIKAPVGTSYYLDCSVKSTSTYTGPAYRGSSISGINLSCDVSNANITLVEGRWVTGTISFPNAINSSVTVNICTESESGYNRTVTSEYLTPTNTSVNYRISALANNTTRVYYEIPDYYFLETNEYVDIGYYGSGGTMATDPACAQVFTAGNTDLTGINLTVIPGGPWVKGTISLPTGQTATQDLIIGIGALDPSNPVAILKSQDVVIPSGGSSASYAMRLLPGQQPCKLGYNIYNGNYCASNGYLQSGLYKSVSETVYASACATVITTDAVNGFANADMTVLTGGWTIEGTVTLPSGLSGDNQLFVKAINLGGNNEWCMTSLLVPAGSASMPYTLVVPDGNYMVSAYLYYGSGDVTDPMNYMASGSITTPVTVTSNISGADITVTASSGSGGGGATPVIIPSSIAPHSILIDNVALGLNSSYYNSGFLIHFGEYGYLYYKDVNSAWYDLTTQTAGPPTNPVDESSLPPIGCYYN